MNEGQRRKPANFENIVAINQGRLPLTMDIQPVLPLSPIEVRRRTERGSIVIDTRAPALFGAAHLPGSYNIQLASSEFEQRVGWIAPADLPIILVVERPEEARDATSRMAFVGLESRLEGFLRGGIPAWMTNGFPYETVPQIDAHSLRALIEKGGAKVLDVREPSEWREGHIEDALNLSYRDMRERAGELDLSPRDSVACICERGYRSSTATSILKMLGFSLVYNVTGGMHAWRKAALPVVTTPACAPR